MRPYTYTFFEDNGDGLRKHWRGKKHGGHRSLGYLRKRDDRPAKKQYRRALKGELRQWEF